MKRIIIPLVFLTMLFACQPNASNSTNTSSPTEEASSTTLPSESTPTTESEELVTHIVDSIKRPNAPEPGALQAVLGEAIGDLDKDGIEEKVMVYNTSRSTDLGTEREIHIFKKEKADWQLWHISQGAVLPSKHGGMMGDPFRKVTIEKGCVVLYQSGGSRIKWAYTHRFRWQEDNWHLIGATVESGTPCLDWEIFDYNLSVGLITYLKEKEHCKQGKKTNSKIIKNAKFIEKVAALPEMDGFAVGGNLALKAKEQEFAY